MKNSRNLWSYPKLLKPKKVFSLGGMETVLHDIKHSEDYKIRPYSLSSFWWNKKEDRKRWTVEIHETYIIIVCREFFCINKQSLRLILKESFYFPYTFFKFLV